jgi:hypothetical protein
VYRQIKNNTIYVKSKSVFLMPITILCNHYCSKILVPALLQKLNETIQKHCHYFWKHKTRNAGYIIYLSLHVFNINVL